MESESFARRSVVSMALVLEGGLGLIAVVLGWLLLREPYYPFTMSILGIGQGLLAAVPMLAFLWLTTRWPVGPLRSLDQLMRQTVVPMFRHCTALDLLWISAAAGIGEELLFRGVLQNGLEQFTGNVPLAVIGASVIFGLAHPLSLTYIVIVSLIGIYLGWLLLWTGELMAPIVAHAAYDFVALVYLTSRRQHSTAIEVEPDDEAVDLDQEPR